MVLRAFGNYDPDLASDAVALSCSEPVLAEQGLRDECDINVLVARFGLTGTMPEAVRLPTYGDFSEALDYQSSLNLIMAAEEGFMTLPWDVRKRFDNDPHQFMAFLEGADRAALKDIGLSSVENLEGKVVKTAAEPRSEAAGGSATPPA